MISGKYKPSMENRHDFIAGINIEYTVEFVTNRYGLTDDDIGGDKYWSQLEIIKFTNLTDAMKFFHPLSHREDILTANVFYQVLFNGVVAMEDGLYEPLLSRNRIETRMKDRIESENSDLKHDLKLHQDFLKKWGAEKQFSEFRRDVRDER
jgi:hypothetical protein